MPENKIEFKINYRSLEIFKEYHTDNILYPLILSSPHSGQILPDEFLSKIKIPIDSLHNNEDTFVDELIKPASEIGIPLLAMNISRVFIDVNRDRAEIDPKMYFNHPSERDSQNGIRCRVGFGVIHRINSQRENIYDGLLDFREVEERIQNVYDAYHKRLQQLIDKTLRKFGFCFVLDCHSMPSKICSVMQENKPIDFCLGTLFEQSCPSSINDFFKNKLENHHYKVTENCPYSGAFITFNYCQPRKNIHTLQLEINRSLYLDEKTYKKNHNFQSVSSDICQSITSLAKFLLDLKK